MIDRRLEASPAKPPPPGPEERDALLREIGGHLTEPYYRVRLDTQSWTTRRVA